VQPCSLRALGTPVPQRSLDGLTVSQPVGDEGAGVSLQLGQNHQNLSEREPSEPV